MRPSLRLLAALSGLAMLCGIASVSVLEYQDKKRTQVTAEQLAGGRVDAGKLAIQRYGCGACHDIPGIDAAKGKVGPSLKGFALEAEIAGRLSNRPDNLVLWLRHPQQVIPGNGMPDMSITDREARDIAAYLYTLGS